MPLSADDRLAVIEVLAEYALSIDRGDVDGYAETFAPDASLVRSGGERIEGREAMRSWMSGMIGSGAVGSDPATLRHFVGMPQIKGDGDRATAETYCVILDYDTEKRIRVPLVCRYEDVLRKVDGRWYIQHRKINGDLGTPPV